MLLMITAILATYRIARMIVYEDGPFDLFAKLRGIIYGKFDHEHWIARGFNCVLCVSFWIAFMIAPLVSMGFGDYVLKSLGIAGAVAIICRLLDE